MIIHNVTDRRYNWVGAWEAEPLCVEALTQADVGRTVIYRGEGMAAEAGTLTSWRDGMVWARFHRGVTAAACDPARLWLATKPMDGAPER